MGYRLEPSPLLIRAFYCLQVCSSDKRIACEEEFSDSEEEGEGGRKNSSNFKKAKRVKTEDEKEKEPEEKKGGFGLGGPVHRLNPSLEEGTGSSTLWMPSVSQTLPKQDPPKETQPSSPAN